MNLQFEAPFAEAPGKTVTSTERVGSSPYVTAEQFGIRSFSVDQQSVKPGRTLTATVEYGSDFPQVFTRFSIDTDHPDYCNAGGFVSDITFTPGADVYLEVESATTATTDGGCWRVDDNGSVTEVANVAVPLTAGTETIEVRLVGRSTGQVYDRDTVEVQVDERAPKQPDPPDPPEDDDEEEDDEEEDDEEEDGSGPLSDLIDTLTFGTDSAAAPLVVLVVILVALLYLTAI
jgi:hypothetical protein